MATISEIYNWFMTGKKPTQAQFWASWGSFWNKSESIPQSAVSNLTTVLNAKAEKTQFDAHKIDPNAHAESIGMKTDKGDYEGTSGDLDNRIAAIENPDRVLKFGTITVTGLNIDIASNAFSWVLNKQEFLTPAVFNDTLDAATTGMYRSDVVVGTQTGGYDIVTGDEAATGAGATEKAPPAGTIRLGYIFLQGNTVLGSGSAPAEEKTTIIDADRIVFDNSQNSYAKASIKLSNFKTVLKAWLDSFFKDRYVTIVDNVTTAYTLQFSNGTKNTLIRHNNASAITETIPANATVAFPIGTEIKSISIGVGLRTVTPAAGVTILNHVSLTSAQNQMMRFIKTATNTWIVTGDVGFEKDIKLTNYPSTRNDGTLPTNKVLAPDVNGNLKLYTIATAPAPYLESLIPDSHLPSATGGFVLKGAFFTPTMTVDIAGQTINSKTFISDNEIRLSVTTGAAEGYFAITLNNGISAVYPNALYIFLGILHEPTTADWNTIVGFPDISLTGKMYGIASGTNSARTFTIPPNIDFRIDMVIEKSPFRPTPTDYRSVILYDKVTGVNKYSLTLGTARFQYEQLNGTYISATGSSAFSIPLRLERIGGVMRYYQNGTYRGIASEASPNDLTLKIDCSMHNFTSIKYVELAT